MAAIWLGDVHGALGGGSAALVTLAPAPAATGAADRAPAFHGRVERIDAKTRARMIGVSWRRGCPVGLADLRLLAVRHWGFDGRPHRGRLVVHRDAAAAMLRTMRRPYALRFPIRQMRLVDAYGADDRRSMAADNTSAFNCRFVAGSPGVWSEHAYGRAIDVNPIENPYVTAPGRRPLRRPLAPPQGNDPPPRPGGEGVRGSGLGMGRQLVLAQGLPALLGDRELIHGHAASSARHG